MAEYIVNITDLANIDYGSFVFFKSKHILNRYDLYKRSITNGYDLGYVLPEYLPISVKHSIMHELKGIIKFQRFNTSNTQLNKCHHPDLMSDYIPDLISLYEPAFFIGKKYYPGFPESKCMLTMFLAGENKMIYAGYLSSIIEKNYEISLDDSDFEENEVL